MAPGNGRDFKCSWEYCGKSFNRKSDLCRHYRTHTNERPHHCKVKDCKKSFIQRSALTIHSRTHTGEKPHFCDHEGCRKAFSDSSSLARHRRVHTGKQLYICQEPTCERSFCSKTALAKHHRSHPLSTTTRPTLEDAISKHSYQNPISTSVANNQSLLAQKSYYSHSFTPTHEFYPPKNIPMTRPAGVQEAPPVIANNVPVPSPVDVQHVRQQYMQQLMQQRYDQGRPGYAPPEFLHLFAGVPTTEGHGLMVTYPQNFQGKQ